MTIATEHFSSATRFFTISTAGHVDHGKTSLIKKLTGIDPDRLKEEKERQMTTDLGFAHLSLAPDLLVGFVDVPGHGKFLKNMLAGVGGIDMALLVVAADEGPMPQTVQHVRILSLLGVSRAIVAITKIDVTDRDTIELVKEEVQELCTAHGITILEFCPISSTKGLGFDELKQAFLRVLKAMPERDAAGPVFLPVDRVFSKAGFGTVITGTLVKGKLAAGDQVLVAPAMKSARVRRVETFGHQVEQARAGQRVACNIVLKEAEAITRGHLIMTGQMPAARSLVVGIIDRPSITPVPLSQRMSDQPVRVYHGTAECHGYLRWVADSTDEASDKTAAIGLLALDDALVAQPRDRCVIRLSDDTIYGGEILLNQRPRWLKKNDLLTIARLLSGGQSEQACLTLVSAAPHKMVKKDNFANLLPAQTCHQLCQALVDNGQLVALAEYVMDKETRSWLSTQVQESLSKLCQSDASGDGVGLENLRTGMPVKLDRQTFQALIDEEQSQNRLVKKQDKLLLPSSAETKTTSQADSDLQNKILQLLKDNFCLDIDETAKALGADAARVKLASQALQKTGQLHIAAYEFLLSDANLRLAHKKLAEVWTAKKIISPGDFRDSVQTSRKYAMALLQHFDDIKVTRRLPSGRVLLKGPQA